MSADEFRRAGHEIVDWIADFLADPRQYPVGSAIAPGDLKRQLPAYGPEQGEPMGTILTDFHQFVLPGVTHWNHPRFLGYFANTGSGPGILGELLTAALNVNGMVWKSCPALTELEEVTLAWLRGWMGMPADWFGIIHDTASMSTLHAILAAREWKTGGNENAGLTLYISEHSHSSVEKGAYALGIARENIRAIPGDEEFRMRADLLVTAIRADRAQGKTPFFVVATVGTTSTASVDPVPEIAAIAEAEGCWLHVDAAYGGALAVLEEQRHLFAGVERADSLVVNPHKWLFVPMDLSVLYTRHKEAMRRACTLSAAYLETADAAVNYMDYSLALGRRFRALKLWFVMRYFGREGIAELLREHLSLAQRFRKEIEEDDRFEVMAPTRMSLVCFRLKGGNEANRELLNRVNGSKQFFLSSTVLNGQFTLRVAIGNMRTKWEDLAELVGMLRAEHV